MLSARGSNQTEAKVRWRFATEDARITLKNLYPVFGLQT
jgi:hypothetical protein